MGRSIDRFKANVGKASSSSSSAGEATQGNKIAARHAGLSSERYRCLQGAKSRQQWFARRKCCRSMGLESAGGCILEYWPGEKISLMRDAAGQATAEEVSCSSAACQHLSAFQSHRDAETLSPNCNAGSPPSSPHGVLPGQREGNSDGYDDECIHKGPDDTGECWEVTPGESSRSGRRTRRLEGCIR